MLSEWFEWDPLRDVGWGWNYVDDRSSRVGSLVCGFWCTFFCVRRFVGDILTSVPCLEISGVWMVDTLLTFRFKAAVVTSFSTGLDRPFLIPLTTEYAKDAPRLWTMPLGGPRTGPG
jgi:hypothetical protein